jgi:hypothetical protein
MHYRVRQIATPKQAELMGSLCNDGWHRPVIDIDHPIATVPTRTHGHHHLLIDVPMSWKQYRRLLRALYKAGLVERSYYKSAIKDHQTFVRARGSEMTDEQTDQFEHTRR